MVENEKKFYYPIEHKVEWIKLYYRSGNSYRDVVSLFHENNPDVPIATHSCIIKTVRKFEETGSVENKKSTGRPKTATSDRKAVKFWQKLL